MAKFGEGDPRWIVADREDGQNVNNWHWAEKDISEWAKKRLKDLLENALIVQLPVCKCSLSSITTEGDCTVYNRKGKISFLMEINVSSNWTGDIIGQDGESLQSCKGKVSFELEHDTVLEKLQIDIKVEKEPEELILKEMRTTGKDTLRTLLSIFFEELKQGHKLTEKKKSDVQIQSPTQSVPMNYGLTQFTQSLEWRAPPSEIWECLTNEKRVAAYTRCSCKINLNVGGEFVFMNGSIVGQYTEIQTLKILGMKWRLRDPKWADGHYSHATITLDSVEEGTTKLQLVHMNVPMSDVERTEHGWRQNFWEPIQMLFGFGLSWK